jgi:hypothetical protein
MPEPRCVLFLRRFLWRILFIAPIFEKTEDTAVDVILHSLCVGHIPWTDIATLPIQCNVVSLEEREAVTTRFSLQPCGAPTLVARVAAASFQDRAAAGGSKFVRIIVRGCWVTVGTISLPVMAHPGSFIFLRPLLGAEEESLTSVISFDYSKAVEGFRGLKIEAKPPLPTTRDFTGWFYVGEFITFVVLLVAYGISPSLVRNMKRTVSVVLASC